jgi:ribosomal protein S18 acetylase RimI-like enzyme
LSWIEVRPFADHDLEAAGTLLAARHARHRANESLLSERFGHADAAVGEVVSLWGDESSGAAGIRDGKLAGFLIGTRKDEGSWGSNVWVEAGGYAADEPELIRDLYAFAAQRWVDEGRTRHYALVPLLDDEVAAWFRLSFGAQQAHGIVEVQPRAWPPGTRRAAEADIETLIAHAPLISEHQALAPVFSGISWTESDDELRTMLAADIADADVGELVYERDGEVVAGFEIVPVEKVAMHGSLARPDRAACISWAASHPGVRGSGAGLALMDAAFAWAHEQGYATIVTDWRETNLLSSRFWPARGFRRTFVRLYRSIP